MLQYLLCIGGIFVSIHCLINPDEYIRKGWFVDGEPIIWIKILTRIGAGIGLISCILFLILFWML